MHPTTITHATTTNDLPEPLRGLALRYEVERRALRAEEAATARTALAALDEGAVRDLLAIAAKKRGAAEVLRQKLEVAEREADAAHRAHATADLALRTERQRLRHAAVPVEEIDAGIAALDAAIGTAGAKYRGQVEGWTEARAAGRAVLLTARRRLFDQRDGVGELLTVSVEDLVAEAMANAERATDAAYATAQLAHAAHRKAVRLAKLWGA